MGQQWLSFLSLISIENDIVQSLTVACREGANRAMALGIQGRGASKE